MAEQYGVLVERPSRPVIDRDILDTEHAPLTAPHHEDVVRWIARAAPFLTWLRSGD